MLRLAVLGFLVLTADAMDPRRDFIEEPASQNLTRGDTIRLTCRAQSASGFGWRVNGTSVAGSSGIYTSTEQAEDGGPVGVLSFEAQFPTTVQCIVTIGDVYYFSSNAALQVQGPLASVTALTAVSSESAISLTWEAPYSLDLSYFQVDILYRVEVCTLMGSEAYNCSCEVVEQPEFSFTERGDDLFQFTVTPLSPRRNNTTHLEGNSSQPVTGFFVGAPLQLPGSAVEVHASHRPLSVQLHFPVPSAPGRVPDSYHVYGETVDPGPPLLLQCADTSATEAVLVLNESSCDNFLPHRIYSITVEARNRAGSANSSEITLSTHSVFRVQTNNCSNPGQVNVSCTFAEGADAVGYFTVLYSMTPGGGHPVDYDPTMGSTGTVNTTIEGLTDASYMVVVFDIGPSGLPETLAAALPQRVDGVEGGGVGSGREPAITNGTSTPNVTASTDTGVCVTAESSGLAVIHSTSTTDTQKMMRLFVLPLTGGMMNCTEPLAGGDYRVTVLTDITLPLFYSEVVTVLPTLELTAPITIPTQENKSLANGLGVGIPLVAVMVAVVVVAILLLCVFWKRRKTKQSRPPDSDTSGNRSANTLPMATVGKLSVKEPQEEVGDTLTGVIKSQECSSDTEDDSVSTRMAIPSTGEDDGNFIHGTMPLHCQTTLPKHDSSRVPPALLEIHVSGVPDSRGDPVPFVEYREPSQMPAHVVVRFNDPAT